LCSFHSTQISAIEKQAGYFNVRLPIFSERIYLAMKLDKKLVTLISKLSASHYLLTKSILDNEPRAYEFFKNHRKQFSEMQEILNEHLDMKTSFYVPSNREEWNSAKKNALKKNARFQREINSELQKKFGLEAIEFYEYCRSVSFYLWDGVEFADKEDLRRLITKIEKYSTKNGVKRKTVEAFIQQPNGDTSIALINDIIAAPNRKTCFISYAKNDSDFVHKLSHCIDIPTVELWIDVKDIMVGDSISKKVEESIPASEYFCLVLSKNSLSSPWVELEYRTAITSYLATRKPIILPILLDKINLPTFMRDVKYANFSNDFDNGINDLLNVLE